VDRVDLAFSGVCKKMTMRKTKMIFSTRAASLQRRSGFSVLSRQRDIICRMEKETPVLHEPPTVVVLENSKVTEQKLTELTNEELIQIILRLQDRIRVLENKEKKPRQPRKPLHWTEQQIEIVLDQKSKIQPILTNGSVHSFMKCILDGQYYFDIPSSQNYWRPTALDVLLYLDWEITQFFSDCFPIVRFMKPLNGLDVRQMKMLSYTALLNHPCTVHWEENARKRKLSQFLKKVGEYDPVELISYYFTQINDYCRKFMLIQCTLPDSFPRELFEHLFSWVFVNEKSYEDRRSETIRLNIENTKNSCANSEKYRSQDISPEDQASEELYYYRLYVVKKKRKAIEKICSK
jgi:hypothetical protein